MFSLSWLAPATQPCSRCDALFLAALYQRKHVLKPVVFGTLKLDRLFWNTFLGLDGYINGGYNYRIPLPGAIIEDGVLKANIEFPGLILRYTTDGSEPGKNSELYEEPVKVSGMVKIKSFDSSGKSSRASIVTAD